MPGLRCASALAVLAAVASGLAVGPAQSASAASNAAAPRVAVVIPIVVPLDAPTILDAPSLERWTAPGGLLSERLDAVTGTPATLAVDPRIYASIRLLGSAAPTTATAWLARLQSLRNDSFALGWADGDVVGLADIDRADLTIPLGLQFAVDPSRFEGGTPAPAISAEATAAATPAPTDNAAGPVLPSDEELLAFDHSIAATWSADDVIASSTGSHHVIGPRVIGPRVTELPAAGTVIAFPRTISEDSLPISATLADFMADARLQIVGLGALPGQPTTVSAITDDRVRLLSRVAAASDAERKIAGVTPDADAFLAERRLELLSALAVGRIEDGTDTEDAYLAASKALLNAVQLADSSDLLVLSNSTGLPVTISNALDVPATVILSARPLRTLLRIQDVPLEVTIEPGSSRTVYLPAQAVTNGRVQVLLSLSTPEGASIGPDRLVNVDLQAQWEAIGIAILVVLGIAFAAGLVSNIVKRRRAAG